MERPRTPDNREGARVKIKVSKSPPKGVNMTAGEKELRRARKSHKSVKKLLGAEMYKRVKLQLKKEKKGGCGCGY